VSECITVYSKPKEFNSFTTTSTDMFDKIIDLRLPIQKIFEW